MGARASGGKAVLKQRFLPRGWYLSTTCLIVRLLQRYGLDRIGARLLFMGLALSVVGGCAQYRMGARSLYQPDISTVYVPIFESQSFRRGLGERLTEAVVKEIELKTPYRVVSDSAEADSILSGRLMSDTKRVIVENNNDDPREVQVNLTMQVSWVNRRGDFIRESELLPLEPQFVAVGQAATLIPEAGQSVETAQQKAIERMATQIVAMMEVPW